MLHKEFNMNFNAIYYSLIKNRIEHMKKNGSGRVCLILWNVKDIEVLLFFSQLSFLKKHAFKQVAEKLGCLACLKQQEPHRSGLSLPDLALKFP